MAASAEQHQWASGAMVAWGGSRGVDAGVGSREAVAMAAAMAAVLAAMVTMLAVGSVAVRGGRLAGGEGDGGERWR